MIEVFAAIDHLVVVFLLAIFSELSAHLFDHKPVAECVFVGLGINTPKEGQINLQPSTCSFASM